LELIREFGPDIKKTLRVRKNSLDLVSRQQPHWGVMDDGIVLVWKANWDKSSQSRRLAEEPRKPDLDR
jgi:hypothetical protein